MDLNLYEQCTVCSLPGSQKYVFCCDEEMVKLCEVIKMKEVKQPTGCIFIGQRSLQLAGDGCKWSQGVWFHLYQIPEDVD